MGKQFYHYDVARWLDGDPASRRRRRRRDRPQRRWRHLNNHDMISMPDKWEYPWYAAWDLGLPLRRRSPTSIRRSPRSS